jgi:hypothetical protein
MLKVPNSTSPISLTVTATSRADSQKYAAALVEITAGPTITTTTLIPGTVGISYNASLSAAGGKPPYLWSVASGNLPSGIQLSTSTGALSGAPAASGTSSFVAELTDTNGSSIQQSLRLLVSPDFAPGQCAAPTYACARTDSRVIPLGPLPDWGGLVGAGKVFYDTGFNSEYAPQYARVTDSTSVIAGYGGAYSVFGVGSGSGDDSHFSYDDQFFWITDSGNWLYAYGLNTDTMSTFQVYAPSSESAFGGGGAAWSQNSHEYLYYVDSDGKIYKLDFSGCTISLACTPTSAVLYDFVANCNLNPGNGFTATGGVGGGDSLFSAAYGPQDSGVQVAAYNSSTNTCYFYNTAYGTVHSYTGHQTPTTGNVSCNGTTAVTGSGFGTGGNSWLGLNLAINGAVHQVTAVASSSSLTVNDACPGGTWGYSIEPGTYVGAVSTSDLFTVHDIRIDPSGTWLIVEEGTSCFSSSCNVIHAWKIGTTTVNDCIWIAGGADYGSCAAHYTETANGWINGDDGFYYQNNPTMQFRTWDNLSATSSAVVASLNTGTGALAPGFDDHPSAKNDPLGTHNYPVFTSTSAPETPVGSINYPYSNEVIAWGQTPGPVMRFGHTFNSSLDAGNFTAQHSIGAVSSTGKFYLFTSDGEGTLGSTSDGAGCSLTTGSCRSDIFILNLLPPPAQ